MSTENDITKTSDLLEVATREFSMRQGYGTLVSIDYEGPNNITHEIVKIQGIDFDHFEVFTKDYGFFKIIDEAKLILRSMDSMTDQERAVMMGIRDSLMKDGASIYVIVAKLHEFLLAHHFDYSGMIEAGAAIQVTDKFNPYIN